MLKTVLKIVECEKDARIGNYSVSVEGDLHRFKYFDNVICMANYKTRKFMVTYCGHENHTYVSRAVSEFRRFFSYVREYKQVYNADEVRESE